MKRTLLTLLAIAAFMLISTAAYAEANRPDKPDRPGNADGQRGDIRNAERPGMEDPFLANPSDAMKAELKRHAEAVRDIAKKVQELRKTIFEELKSEIEKEKARIEAENPDAENPPRPDIQAITDKLKEKYKQQIEEVVKAGIDENIKHAENVLAIKKLEKDAMIKKLVERFTDRVDKRGNGEGRGNGDGEDIGPNRGNGKRNGNQPERPPIE